MSTALPTAPKALRELMMRLREVGHVMALTRNEAAVHEKDVHPAENLERR